VEVCQRRTIREAVQIQPWPSAQRILPTVGIAAILLALSHEGCRISKKGGDRGARDVGIRGPRVEAAECVLGVPAQRAQKKSLWLRRRA